MSPEAITILQVLPALSIGGVERGTIDIAQAIMAEGGRALVASAGGRLVPELERCGAKHITLPLDRKAPWSVLTNRARLARVIREEGVDVVHARSRAPAWSALWAARHTGVPFVTTYHGTYSANTRLKRWYNSVMARGDRVIAISDFIASHVAASYPETDGRLVTIARGIDLDAFDPMAVRPERVIRLATEWRLADGAPVVMLPGRITRWKGHTVAIEALAALGRPDVQLVLVGEDQGRAAFSAELASLVRARGLEGQVRFVGPCRDMPAALMLADVVISASIEPEAFGRVAAEGGAMGRLVIATDHGGARETIGVDAGWLVPPGDPAALSAALADALDTDAAERLVIGRRARAHVAARFTRAAMQAATLRVYADLVRR
ncbi:MAG: glycosyltransferase family 4 protein [Alphaproteobacteria bacterium]|nr:glycosyltransferase family 4 protein [Alphaproteobacteria bacterium]